MYIRKVMTGFAAVTVAVVSISMFGVMWNVNRFAQNLEPVVLNSDRRWAGRDFAWEIIVKDGSFEKFVFYRKPLIYMNVLNHNTVGRVPDGILE